MRIYTPVDGPDRLPQAMVEGSTEFDWAELPFYLQDIIRTAARELAQWAETQDNPIRGELVPDSQPSLVQTQAARLRATLDERLGRGAPQTEDQAGEGE